MKRNIKRTLSALLLGAAAAAFLSFTALAAVWSQDDRGVWHYDYLGRGSSDGFLKNQWAWIDGNHDGISECYYFDAAGDMKADTEIDGYSLDAGGRWTVDGVVQTRQNEIAPQSSENALQLIDTEPAESSYYSRFETAQTASGLSWSGGMKLSGDLSRAAHASYRFDKQYQTLTITFAPEAGQEGAENGRVSVTGLTSGKTLYRSEKLSPSAEPVSVRIGVANEEGVRINIIRGCVFLFHSVSAQ